MQWKGQFRTERILWNRWDNFLGLGLLVVLDRENLLFLLDEFCLSWVLGGRM